jgi:hypothetical protein
MVAAWLIITLCLIYFAGRTMSLARTREGKLKAYGETTGLNRSKGAASSNRRRFSLLDLLVAVTLVAALGGAIIGTSNQERDGIPRFRLSDEIEKSQQREN